MQDIEAIGLLKMDLLGLRNLTVIQDAVELVEKDLGEKVDIRTIPLEDPATFALFQAGNTDGVFQFESSGMKDLLRNYKPESFRDLIALNALYRPGPLNSGMTAEFVKRKNHPDQISYELTELEPILKETRGIIVFQEQVMKIATELAGFSLAEADILRKAMGKKVTSIMKAQKQRAPRRETSPRPRRTRSSSRSSISPNTGSTNPTAQPTLTWPTRPLSSRPIIPPISWPPC
jgi:DNA polymerase-3 subunit alpha